MKRQTTAIGFLMLTVLCGAGCSTAPSKESGSPPSEAYYERNRIMLDDAEAPLLINDPWEGLNRRIFRFNSYADRFVLNPAVSVYEFIFPGFVRKGVSNFFTNLDNIQTVVNQVLQFQPVPALQTTGRFVANTTVGMAGLLDPATPMGIPQHYEDFGQTLGTWGMRRGPYVVLPLFGPSFARDAGGKVVDSAIFSAIDPLRLDNVGEGYTYAYWALLVLNTRSTTAFQYYQTGSPFEYELVRLVWATKRQLDIEKH